MTQHALLFFAGVALLVMGGRLLVAASVDTARRLGVPPLVVGLTLVAWGTSAPELALNLVSAFKDRGDLALGNVVGANICNMALVLGISALIRPLAVEMRLLKIEVNLNVLILGSLAALGIFLGLPMWASGAMLGTFLVYSAWTIIAAMRAPRQDAAGIGATSDPAVALPMSWLRIAGAFVLGLTLLSLGGTLASDAASAIAVALGVPPAVVGVTIVSIGTTLPEMVTSVLAVRKGQTDLALGNALGSCLFNAGAIFGLAGLISPPDVGADMQVPMVYMAVLALVLVVITRTHGRTIARIEGAMLLLSYAAFLTYAALTVQRTP